MKLANLLKACVLGLSLLVAAGAFAANKGAMEVSGPVSVAGTHIDGGAYTVNWEGNGPNVDLNIVHGKKVVAKVPAHLVELNTASQRDSAVVSVSGDGSRVLHQIRFSGKKYALEFGEEMGGGASSSGSGMR